MPGTDNPKRLRPAILQMIVQHAVIGHADTDQAGGRNRPLVPGTFVPSTFNPFEEDFAGRAGYCLLTLQIGVWASHWSASSEPFPSPPGYVVPAVATP